MNIEIVDFNGQKTGESMELNPEVFGVRRNDRLMADVLKGYAANQRRGTHKSKERAEVRGGGKKPWKQKGTGRARAGSSRNPIWRGGGTVFGPRPRDYSVHLPRELRRQALAQALTAKFKENNIIVIDKIEIAAPKTSLVYDGLAKLELNGSRALFVADLIDENFKLASRNLDYIIAIAPAYDVAAYHIMRRPKLIMSRKAVEVLEDRVLERVTNFKPKAEDLEAEVGV